jgi:RND family efflux transporter MFP subunit
LGQWVTANQLLFELDKSRIQAQLEQARAALSSSLADSQAQMAELSRIEGEVASDLLAARSEVAKAKASQQISEHLTRPQQLAQARARQAALQNQSQQARREAQRLADLWQEGAISQQDYERAQTAADVAAQQQEVARQELGLALEGARQEERLQSRAQLSSAQAQSQRALANRARILSQQQLLQSRQARAQAQAQQVQELEILLARHELRAPISGRVLEVTAHPGDLLKSGQLAVTVADLRQMKACFLVSESQRRQLREGQKVQVRIASQPWKTLKLTHLGYEADDKTRQVAVEAWFSNQAENLLPQEVAHLQLADDSKSTQLKIPLSAVLFEPASSYVFAVEGKQWVRKDVVLGEPQGEWVSLHSGLRLGEEIATQPQLLRAGQQVSQ